MVSIISTTNNKSNQLVKLFQLTILYIFYFYINIINDPKIYSAFFFIILFLATVFISWDKSKKFSSVVLLFFSLIFISTITFKAKELIYTNNLVIDRLSNYSKEIDYKYNIFFIETNKTRNKLSMKELCSIESAALNNPNANIYLYSLNASNLNLLASAYKNVKYVKLVPENVFNNTRLMPWWNKNKNTIKNATYSIQDLSDSVRLSLLWKHGGFYSDLDTITIRSFNNLLSYTGLGFITEFGKPMLANGVLNFPKHHKLLEEAMINLSNDYNPNFWGYNGPLLFIRTIKSYCKMTNFYDALMINEQMIFNSTLNEIELSKRKCDINIFPEGYFYPLSWQNYKPLYEKNGKIDISKFIQTYSVHFFGKFSDKIKVKSDDMSIYEFFALRNCPVIYKLTKINDIFF